MAQRTERPRVDVDPRDALRQALAVRRVELTSVTLTALDDGSLSAAVEFEGVPKTLRLFRHSLRSENFQVLVQRKPLGPLEPTEAPPVQTYRGVIEGEPGSHVAARVFGDTIVSLTALVRTREGVYGIQPMAGVDKEIDESRASMPGDHVVYRAEDWANEEGFHCGAEGAVFELERDEAYREEGSAAGTGLSTVDVAIDADVEFFQLNGSSVAGTVLDIENVMNSVEAIYERDVTITYEITTIVVRTAEPDPYRFTDPGSLLCEFRARWNATPESYIQRDTAHLFTGKNIDGSTIGIAFVGVVCNPSGFVQGCSSGNVAYGLSQSRYTTAFTSRTALTAHELGHNWGAGHCSGSDCHIMCATIGACAGIAGSNLKFGATESAQILSHKSTRGCLVSQPEALSPPFVEGFSSTLLAVNHWTYILGAVISLSALGEPSGTLSLNLDGAGPEPYRDDEIRTNFMLLGSTSAPTVSYWTEHRGVSLGETLVVEYWNSGLRWVELNRVVSNGLDQSTFQFHQHTLPADARHNEFRLRFRTEVNGSTEDWFIDDVVVRNGCASDAECDDGLFCNGVEPCVNQTCQMGATPCAAGLSCDELNGVCFDATCPPPSLIGFGARYLSVAPSGTTAVALKVGAVCDIDQGQYLTAPAGPENVSLPAADSWTAPFLTAIQWGGTVYAYGETIAPDTTYYARGDCGAPGQPRLSALVTAKTPRWGDTAGSIVAGVYSPPNGFVDIVDGTSILDRFRGTSTAPSLQRTDLSGSAISDCLPNRMVDILDLVSWVGAFQGQTYRSQTDCHVPCTFGKGLPFPRSP